jgi:hypothetical protein
MWRQGQRDGTSRWRTSVTLSVQRAAELNHGRGRNEVTDVPKAISNGVGSLGEVGGARFQFLPVYDRYPERRTRCHREQRE